MALVRRRGRLVGSRPDAAARADPRLALLVIPLAARRGVARRRSCAGSGRFVDDDHSRFENAIEAMAAAGIMKPCDPPRNDRFCPKGSVSRGEMAVFLVHGRSSLTATSGVRVQGRHLAERPRRRRSTGWSRRASPRGAGRSGSAPSDQVSRGRMAGYLAKALQLTATGSKRYRTSPKSNPFATAINRLAKAGVAIGCGERQVLPGPGHHPGRDGRLPRSAP